MMKPPVSLSGIVIVMSLGSRVHCGRSHDLRQPDIVRLTVCHDG